MFIQQSNPNILTTPYRYSAAWDEPLDIPEAYRVAPVPDALKAAHPRRRAEFIAGRFCAAKAIEALDPGAPRQVGIHPDGSPRWPESLVGSITHTEGFVSAAVAANNVSWGLGIDSEKLTAPDVLRAAQELIVQDSERRLMTRLSLLEEHVLILIFSAKESIYKCLHPLVKRPFDFGVVCLEDIDVQNSTFNFRLIESLHRDFPADFSAQGRFEFSQGCVHTAVELGRGPFRTS